MGLLQPTTRYVPAPPPQVWTVTSHPESVARGMLGGFIGGLVVNTAIGIAAATSSELGPTERKLVPWLMPVLSSAGAVMAAWAHNGGVAAALFSVAFGSGISAFGQQALRDALTGADSGAPA